MCKNTDVHITHSFVVQVFKVHCLLNYVGDSDCGVNLGENIVFSLLDMQFVIANLGTVNSETLQKIIAS